METTSIKRLLWSGAILAALTALPATAGATQQESEEIEREVRARIEFGRARSEIGVSVRDVEDADGPAEGAVVTDVRADGPAAAAGIEAGDVIVEFDGERVRGARQLARLVEETPVGRTASVQVLRDGSPTPLSVTPRESSGWMARFPRAYADRVRVELEEIEDGLAETEEFTALRRLPEIFRGVGVPRRSGRVRLGIRADSVDGQLAEYFGADAGVLVEHVDDGAAGADAGLRAGDVITAIDGDTVDGLAELRRRLARIEAGAAFDITLMRDRTEMSLTAQAPAREERERRPRRRGPAI